MSVVVIVWTIAKIFPIGDVKIPWPGLDKAVFITLYNTSPTARSGTSSRSRTGTAILVAAIITAFVGQAEPRASSARRSPIPWVQTRIAILTVATDRRPRLSDELLGPRPTRWAWAWRRSGRSFRCVSAFLGWVAVFLSGSDTSGNALFGNLQVVAAKQLNLNPVLMAATNSSGGVMGKMISPQNISTGVATTDLKGQGRRRVRAHLRTALILTTGARRARRGCSSTSSLDDSELRPDGNLFRAEDGDQRRLLASGEIAHAERRARFEGASPLTARKARSACCPIS